MLSIFLFCSICVHLVFAIDLTLVLNKDSSNTFIPHCVAKEQERYKGIGWIYPIPQESEDLPETATSFLPKIENEYNCKFSNNERCISRWILKNWEISNGNTKTLGYISDERWEDFPIIFISNETKAFKDRIEFPSTFNLGFSVRASTDIEAFLCEGWDPENYPCYQLKIGLREITLSKFKTLTENSTVIDSYQAYLNILTKDEWRNFRISSNGIGKLELVDINLNRTVIELVDNEALKPVYFLFRSIQPSLWKIHQTQFFYTTTSQISRLGPILNIPANDICITLYISICTNCQMTFFIMDDGAKENIRQEQLLKNGDWTLIRLVKENVKSEKVNIFVETSFIQKTNITEGFWAVDDVRVCHLNEVRVMTINLMTKIDENDETVSCQVVEHPRLRAQRVVVNKEDELPLIKDETTSNSISLTWNKVSKNADEDYFIQYQANDICENEPYSLKRLKSNGFIVTKTNSASIQHLVPYTLYNITISSTSNLNKQLRTINTKESDELTLEELPNDITVNVTDTTAQISWDKIECFSSYGHIYYTLEIKESTTNNVRTITHLGDNTVEIKELLPYTKYHLKLITSRNPRFDVHNIKTTGVTNLEFVTKPGLADAVQNLEIYATSIDQIFLRYDLPEKGGTPSQIQIVKCSSLMAKCKTLVLPVKQCILYRKKYCITLNNLVPNLQYKLKVSLKNEGTHTFGKEAVVEGLTSEHVPGAPTNLTYRIVDCQPFIDYCHLNITWLHPYDQNGTITSFNIVLDNTDGLAKEFESIKEILKITNDSYQRQYFYQIKYVPYSKNFNLSIQSVNAQLKSKFSTIYVRTDNLGDHIDQSPKIVNKTDHSAEFKLPIVDHRLSGIDLQIIVQDFNKEKKIEKEILDQKNISDFLCHDYGTTWALQKQKITNFTRHIIVDKLTPQTNYCVTFVVTNFYKNSSHQVVYIKKLETLPLVKIKESSSEGYLFLLILLLLIPLAALGIWYYRKKKRQSRYKKNKENEYETLPFEDNIANNNMYDHLRHK